MLTKAGARKKISVADVIKAAEENGFVFFKGWHDSKYDAKEKKQVISKACVLGQAAINLGISGPSLRTALDNIAADWTTPGSDIMKYNDNAATSYRQALAFLKKTLAPYKNRVIQVPAYDWSDFKLKRKTPKNKVPKQEAPTT
jgi:hypothetical protein